MECTRYRLHMGDSIDEPDQSPLVPEGGCRGNWNRRDGNWPLREGLARDEQMDLQRELPAATGVIDIQTFLQALIE
ncbi:MAG: hypothetical protein ACQESR_24265, partial [Planctomycetota bacterium]